MSKSANERMKESTSSEWITRNQTNEYKNKAIPVTGREGP
jgi:hypothetical protein